ncbi:MAG: iron-sulfur cluster assembly scaffold protein [Pseudomonadota bacterium]
MSDADQDLISLYSKRILALAADIPHVGRLDGAQASVKKRSPLCGSTVTVDLSLEDGRICDFGQEVKACALGQASAAVLGAQALGRTREEIAAARDQLKAMLKAGGPVPAAPFDGYEALQPAKDYKNRHASILLCLDATLAAMEEAEAAATAEG